MTGESLSFVLRGAGEARTRPKEPRSRLVLTIGKPSGAVGVMESPMRRLPVKTSEAKAERLQSAATLHQNSRNILQLRGLRLFLMLLSLLLEPFLYAWLFHSFRRIRRSEKWQRLHSKTHKLSRMLLKILSFTKILKACLNPGWLLPVREKSPLTPPRKETLQK